MDDERQRIPQKTSSSCNFFNSRSKKLSEKELKDLFGVISSDKGLKRCIDETRKSWEDLDMNYSKVESFEKPLKPNSLVFLLRLAVETPKKKKFDIYALGTNKRYSIMTNRF